MNWVSLSSKLGAHASIEEGGVVAAGRHAIPMTSVLRGLSISISISISISMSTSISTSMSISICYLCLYACLHL